MLSVPVFISLCLFVLFSSSLVLASSSCFHSSVAPLAVWQSFPDGQQNTCAPGFYCPALNPLDNTTFAVVCPPSAECSYQRLDSKICPPQGTFEPQLCPEGFYCPTFKQMIQCPAGSFCPPGSVQPRSCSLLSSCPAGSGSEAYYGSLLIVLLFDLGLACLISAYRRREVRKLRPAVSQSASDDKPASVGDSGLAESFRAAQSDQFNQLEIEFDNLSLLRPIKPVKGEQDEQKAKEQSGNQDFSNAAAEEKGANQPLSPASASSPSGRQVLNGVSGHFRPGRVCAILGSSGAGKSTLLNLLLGKTPRDWTSTGFVRINGAPVSLDSLGSGSPLSRILGMVPQDDILRTELTVWENIEYAASIRLPSKWSREQINRHVESVISALGLQHIRNQRIGDEFERGISGGERKRVSIAVELAGAPLALLLDEPSTGLSSKNSLDLFSLLSSISRTANIAVAMVVHQPRIEAFHMFDDLLLLAKGGVPVYEGPTNRAFQYFEENFKINLHHLAEENPADKIMDEITNRGASMHKYWMEKGRAQIHGESKQIAPAHAVASNDVEAGLKSACAGRGASFLSHLFHAFVRSLRSQHAMFGSLVLELLIASFAGLIMGLAARLPYRGVLVGPYALISPVPDEQAVPRAGMLQSMGVSMSAAFSGVSVFYGISEQLVRWREARAGHAMPPYYIGLVLCQGFRNLIGAVHFATMYHLISAPFISYSDLLAIVFLLYFGWYGWATCIASLTSKENSTLVSVVGALIFSALNGYVNAVPVFVLYISHCFWASEAYFTRQTEPFVGVMQVEAISADAFQYTYGRFETDMGILFAVAIAYHAIGFLLLVRKNKQH